MTGVDAKLRRRGEILRKVRVYGGQGLSLEGLQRIFQRAGRLGSFEQLEEDVRYLAEKEYLRKELLKDRESLVERWLVWITPQGIDLLDGVIGPDPGVEIVC